MLSDTAELLSLRGNGTGKEAVVVMIEKFCSLLPSPIEEAGPFFCQELIIIYCSSEKTERQHSLLLSSLWSSPSARLTPGMHIRRETELT